jgi:hypothetical protein
VPVSELSAKNFGIVIAFILPGFVALLGVSCFSTTVVSWIAASQGGKPTVAGFCYVSLASLAAGLTVSAVRWALLDTLHHATGVTAPVLQFAHLDDRLNGFLVLVENHYKFYLFYGNAFVAAAFSYSAYLVAGGFGGLSQRWWTVGFLLLEIVLFAGSRDTLKRYYSRTAELLNHPQIPERNTIMTNGIGLHDHETETPKKAVKKKKASEAKTKPAKPDKSTAR